MYYLKTEQCFDSAHFLKNYPGKCGNLHGHRWRVIVEISGNKLNGSGQTEGMLIDFIELKNVLKDICDNLDHCLIYESGSLHPETVIALKAENFRLMEVPFRPTAENFAKYFYQEIADHNYHPHRVEVYETPENCAAYEEDE